VKILENGFEHEYSQLSQAIGEPLTEDECKFVIDTLVMYDALQQRHSKNKDDVPADLGFPGFDGNNEWSYLAY
jgi:uncharacterized protein YfbU (UPF0304 family)